jgi:hypothetical protein
LVQGRIYRHGLSPGTGVPWLDEPGEDEVVVRLSRAIGLPGGLPDIHGLAVRIPRQGGGHGDLLFASTGWGRLSRFVLTAGRSPQARPMTTLLPYHAPRGPLCSAPAPTGPETFELSCAPAAATGALFADLRFSLAPSATARSTSTRSPTGCRASSSTRRSLRCASRRTAEARASR